MNQRYAVCLAEYTYLVSQHILSDMTISADIALNITIALGIKPPRSSDSADG